ncbi:hypothetical protein BDQ12DRAFT_678298 [Crucibulum laeve]|uniref:Uncharacterized protein n=1 Tax=Crucibulum laeve TaxID=68775 RepID=A0A5C3MAJ4_9AGAR|nr:hypothetical protein BDQ12DRAFT_678298 [Crucibulum laeve]
MRFFATIFALSVASSSLAIPMPKGAELDGSLVSRNVPTIWEPAKNMVARIPKLFQFRRSPDDKDDILLARELEGSTIISVRDLPPSIVRSSNVKLYMRYSEAGLEDISPKSPDELHVEFIRSGQEVLDFAESTASQRTRP